MEILIFWYVFCYIWMFLSLHIIDSEIQINDHGLSFRSEIYSIVPKVFAENGGRDLRVILRRMEKRMLRS